MHQGRWVKWKCGRVGKPLTYTIEAVQQDFWLFGYTNALSNSSLKSGKMLMDDPEIEKSHFEVRKCGSQKRNEGDEFCGHHGKAWLCSAEGGANARAAGACCRCRASIPGWCGDWVVRVCACKFIAFADGCIHWATKANSPPTHWSAVPLISHPCPLSFTFCLWISRNCQCISI